MIVTRRRRSTRLRISLIDYSLKRNVKETLYVRQNRRVMSRLCGKQRQRIRVCTNSEKNRQKRKTQLSSL